MVKGLSKLIMPGALTDFFAQAAGAGYEAVELVIAKEGELTLDAGDDKIAEIKALSAKYGLPVVSVVHSQCTGNLLDGGDERKRSVEETIKGLKIAAALGAKVTLHTMGSLREDLYYDDAYFNAVQSLKMIAPAARATGVKLAVEFVWSGFLFSPLEMKKLLDDVNNPYIGFYFDPGNMAVFQYPQHWARILGRHILMVHAKDWRGNTLNGSWPALLTGNVNFKQVMAELRAAGYDDAFISEVDPATASIKETAAAMDEIIAMF